MDSLANRLILVRSERRLSQRAAADECGLTFGEWQGMESGRGTRRLDLKIRQIAMALGVDRDWLMWGGPLNDETPPPNPNEGPDGGDEVRHQGLEPRTRWFEASAGQGRGNVLPLRQPERHVAMKAAS